MAWRLLDLMKHCNEVAVCINGKYVPAKPVPFWGVWGFQQRCKDAWAVLTGKADAFTWPEDDVRRGEGG